MNECVRIGTRSSRLALWQANWVKSRLEALHPGIEVILVHIKTEGDRIDIPLFLVGGKGLFVKEIEEALLRGEIDLAVHSAKDLPAIIPNKLILTAFPAREDPRDVLLSRNGETWKEFPRSGKIGTSSPRRKAQLLNLRPDLEVVPLRGNLDTRIKKLETLDLNGIILASAGIKRMGWEQKICDYFDPQVLVPAIGQGVLAIETHEQNSRVRELVADINHLPTALEIQTERSFLQKLGGGCQVPIAGIARVKGDTIRFTGLVASVTGQEIIRGEREGSIHEAEHLGSQLAQELLAQGAAEILREVYR
jgi:hydroxymethylbilane synthase